MIISSGEALIDFTSTTAPDGKLAYQPHVGGSPYNVALGLGRLGAPAGFLSRIGDDVFGRMLKAELVRSQVSQEFISHGNEPSMLAFVHVVNGEPEYSFYAEGTAHRMFQTQHLMPLPANATIHFGSIALIQEPVASTLLALMQRESRQRILTLDPNVRPSMIENREKYLTQLHTWLGLVDVVKVSRADLEWLYPTRTQPGQELTVKAIEDIAKEWQAFGAALMLVTLGGDGAIALNKTCQVQSEPIRVQVADTVGAGDAFMSGTLTWLFEANALNRDTLANLNSAQLLELLNFASRVAAITCTRVGANPPFRNEL